MDGNSRTWELGQVFKSHEIFVDIKVTNFHAMGLKKTHTQQGYGASSLLKHIAICSKFKPDHSFFFLNIQRRKNKEMFP
jgi:hypothetical protein